MLRGLMRLEERIVLDASAGDDADGVDEADGNRILVVDRNVDGSELLASAARDGVTVVVYDSQTDTLDSLLDKIRDAGEGLGGISSIAFASHGEEAEMRLTADGLVSITELAANPDLAAFWTDLAGLLAEDGRIDILACDFYRGEEGRELLAALEALTGVNFAASDDRTGNPEYDGDWFLESDDIALEDAYFDLDFLADFAFLGDYTFGGAGNGMYFLPDSDELELSEGMSVLEWEKVLGDTIRVDAGDLKLILTWDGPGAMSDAFDISFINQTPPPGVSYAIFIPTMDSILVTVESSYISSVYTGMVRSALSQLTMKAADNWEGYNLTVQIGLGGPLLYTVGKTYTLTAASNNIGGDAPPVDIEPGPDEPGLDVPVEETGESDVTSDDADDGAHVDRFEDLDREYLSAMTTFDEFTFELLELPDGVMDSGIEAEVAVEMRDVQIALRELHGSLTLLLSEYAQSSAGTGESLRQAIGEIVSSAQSQISLATRLVRMASDAAREWNDLPEDRRDGSIGEAMASFAQKLLETNASVSAAVEGVNAARESIAGADGSDAPDSEALLARVTELVEGAFLRIRAELDRRDSTFYDLELQKVRQNRVASSETGGAPAQ